MVAIGNPSAHIIAMTKYSLLDLVPVVEGGTVADALANAADLARHAEAHGYNRYWVAEHHGMEGIASAATAVVIAHVGAATSTIRVGAGGIMLPNHAPLQIAEQFGTLDALFPGRIDLGLGAWGAAQRGASRVDAGPWLSTALPVAGRSLRLSLEWRQRLAGRATPSSGPALTIGTDF